MTTELILLGTGSPSCLPDKYQAGTVVIVEDRPYLFDCGGGTIQRLGDAAGRYGSPGLAMDRLTHLFISHLHPDHTVGLPDFLIAPWVKGRQDEVHIWGPAGIEGMIHGLVSLYEPGIAEHRDGLAPIHGTIRPVTHPLTHGTIYTDERLEVAAFPVSHGTLEAYGFKLTTADGTIVISGDTKPVAELVKQAAGCTLLVHEVYNAATLARRTPEWKRYFDEVHTSTIQLAEIARQTRPQLTVTTHNIFFPPDSEGSTLAEITDRYDGAVAFGRDLDRFVLEKGSIHTG